MAMIQHVSPLQRQELSSALALTDAVEVLSNHGKTFQSALNLAPRDMERCFQHAQSLMKLGSYAEAADAFLLLATFDPACYDYWAQLAECEKQQQHIDLALEALSLAVLANPERAEPQLLAAECYLDRNQIPQAKASLELARPALKKPDVDPDLIARFQKLVQAVKR